MGAGLLRFATGAGFVDRHPLVAFAIDGVGGPEFRDEFLRCGLA